MIKKLTEPRFTYFESEQRFELEVNGKKVIAFKYQKQDPQFGEYDSYIELMNKKDYTEEEIEEVEIFINDKEI
jgi:hypothetical protein